MNADDTAKRPEMTAAGLAVLWAGVGLLVAGGWRFDGALIWLGMLSLAALAVARVWARRNLRGLRVWRERPARVFAGELFEWTMSVERTDDGRRSWLPGAVAVEIRDLHLPRSAGGVWVAGLAGGEKAAIRQRTRRHKRGRDARGEYEAVSRFPLGLFKTRVTGSFCERAGAEAGLLVCPQPILTPLMSLELERAQFDASFPHGIDPEPGEEFRGVREYRSGDPVKAVHWGATARAGRMMVREWDPPSPQPVRLGLLVHTLESGGAPSARLRRPENWETILRMAAGIAAHCRAAEIPLRFASAVDGDRVERREIPFRDGYGSVFDWAALVQRGGAAPEAAVADALKALAPGCDRVIVLSDVPLASWSGRLARLCPGVGLICCDSQSVSRPPRRRAGGKTLTSPTA